MNDQSEMVLDDDEVAASSKFDNALHRLFNGFARIKDDNNTLQEFQTSLQELVTLCGDDASAWKTLLLAIIYKRYHRLSPTCKAQTDKPDASAGDGERRFYYEAIKYLFTHEHCDAALTLIKVAPLAGGSRDLCTIVVDLISAIGPCPASPVSFSEEVVKGLRFFEQELVSPKPGSHFEVMKCVLDTMAKALNGDFAILQGAGDTTMIATMPSTLHMFLPHRDRGRVRRRRNENDTNTTDTTTCPRRVNNAIAELMIWKRTTIAHKEKAFGPCYEKLLSNSFDQDTAKKSMFILQAITRKLRKKLNDYARENGFMLSDQFTIDKSKLNKAMVLKGKEGDLHHLAKLAKKKHDVQTLKLVQSRSKTDPCKITKFRSVHELLEACPSPETNDDDEMAAVQRSIYTDRVSATIKYLRKQIKTHNKATVVASLENSKSQHAAAILVVAAMSTWPLETDDDDSQPMDTKVKADDSSSKETIPPTRLLLVGSQRRMESFLDCLGLLMEVAQGVKSDDTAMNAPSFITDGIVTTKAVMNLIDRHVNKLETLVLLSDADIRLPQDVLKDLASRGSSIHIHDAEGLGGRLQREKARKGDITISLAWDTFDDLDLHVFIPGGEEISFRRKQSLDGLCNLDVDMNAGSQSSLEPVENVFLGDLDGMIQAPCGSYKVVIQNYAYHDKRYDGEVNREIPFRVTMEKDGVKNNFTGICKGSGSESDVTVIEFEYSGRKAPWPRSMDEKSSFGTSNLVNLTASTGSTLESLAQLAQITQQLEHMDTVRDLVVSQESDVMEEDSDERPVFAASGTFEITNRDRIYILLAKLPKVFHEIVGEAYGGQTLAVLCAQFIAQRMVADRLPMSALSSSGYPEDVVEAVKQAMVVSDAM